VNIRKTWFGSTFRADFAYLVLVLGPRKDLVKAVIRPPLHRVPEFAGVYPLSQGIAPSNEQNHYPINLDMGVKLYS